MGSLSQNTIRHLAHLQGITFLIFKKYTDKTIKYGYINFLKRIKNMIDTVFSNIYQNTIFQRSWFAMDKPEPANRYEDSQYALKPLESSPINKFVISPTPTQTLFLQASAKPTFLNNASQIHEDDPDPGDDPSGSEPPIHEDDPDPGDDPGGSNQPIHEDDPDNGDDPGGPSSGG